MKCIIFLLLYHFVSLVTWAQNIKCWSDGELHWSDFQETYTSIITGAELYYIFGYETEKINRIDTIFFRTLAKAYVDRSQSYVHTYSKNEKLLKYNQVIFDILELYRRKLQIELDRINNSNEIQNAFQRSFNNFNERLQNFKQQSDYGNKSNVTYLWREGVREELTTYSDDNMPHVKTRNFGYGLNAGFGIGIITGGLNEYFTPSFNFMYGFDFSYKKTLMFLSGSLGWNNLKIDFSDSDEIWTTEDKTGVTIIDASLGYAILDKSKIKFTPFAGFSLIEFSTRTNNKEEKSKTLLDFGFIGGLTFDYKIKKILKFQGITLMGKELNERSIRTRIYITYADYSPQLKGYSVNLAIGYNVFGRGFKIMDTKKN